VADTAQQFDRVRSLADGETEYLHGVIEFYQTVLSVKSTLLGQAQNEKVQQLTEASYAQNEEIKKISAWAAIFFAPTLIGTVYGMNFDHMPELHWVLGYPLALLAMVLLSVGLVQTAQVAVKRLISVPEQRRLDHLKVVTRRRLSDHLSHATPSR
jgi:magnesium transporter